MALSSTSALVCSAAAVHVVMSGVVAVQAGSSDAPNNPTWHQHECTNNAHTVTKDAHAGLPWVHNTRVQPACGYGALRRGSLAASAAWQSLPPPSLIRMGRGAWVRGGGGTGEADQAESGRARSWMSLQATSYRRPDLSTFSSNRSQIRCGSCGSGVGVRGGGVGGVWDTVTRGAAVAWRTVRGQREGSGGQKQRDRGLRKHWHERDADVGDHDSSGGSSPVSPTIVPSSHHTGGSSSRNAKTSAAEREARTTHAGDGQHHHSTTDQAANKSLRNDGATMDASETKASAAHNNHQPSSSTDRPQSSKKRRSSSPSHHNARARDSDARGEQSSSRGSRSVYGAATTGGHLPMPFGQPPGRNGVGRPGQRNWATPEERERRELEVREGLQRAEREFGATHPRVGAHMFVLSRMVQERGNYGEAEELCAKALQIYESSLGPEHPDVGVALNCLALSWQAQVCHCVVPRRTECTTVLIVVVVVARRYFSTGVEGHTYSLTVTTALSWHCLLETERCPAPKKSD